MDRTKMIQAMKASISEVLEQMFFLPIDMVDADSETIMSTSEDNRNYMAKIGFDGPASGTFQLRIPTGLAASISADFLGTLVDDLTVEEIAGTVKEMLNMLAGNSLSAYDPKASFNLRLPELIESPPAAKESKAAGEVIDICIETMDSSMSLNMTG